MTKFGLAIASSVLALAATAPVNAAVTLVGSQATFDALGTIAQNTNFDTNGPNFTTPGSPFTIGALSFIEGGQNLIGGQAGYGFVRSLLTDNFVRGTTVQIAGLFDLFALNAGNFFSAGTADFAVTTNLGSYNFAQNVSSAANGGALTFVGFRADAGEHFTSVRYSGGFATGATDIQLGNAGVPEPAAWALMIAGFGLVGAAARRRQSVRVAYA